MDINIKLLTNIITGGGAKLIPIPMRIFISERNSEEFLINSGRKYRFKYFYD